VPIGRNDPCPCGSGAKYKRCCLARELEAERVVAELETAVAEIGAETWRQEPEWCEARFAEFYDGGLEAFGVAGPDPDELLEAELWFLLDCPLPSGETSLWRARRHDAGRAVELLARSELRVWRVEAIGADKLLTASCPLDSGRVRLELARRPEGQLEPGALIVARSVPLGPERWTLLGAAPIVDPDVQAEFNELIASLDAPRGEFWRVHGGVLAHAAWAWPTERGITLEGDPVDSPMIGFEPDDLAEVVAALDGDHELDGHVEDPMHARRWRWRWDPPRAYDPPAEPGVRYQLCKEDVGPDRYFVDIDVNDDGEVWIVAASWSRLALATRLLSERCGALLGPACRFFVDCPDVTPRWRERRMRRTFSRMAPAIRRARRAAA
jgi:hypothetical protein